MADAIRQIGVTPLTYYRWRRAFGGMGQDQVKELAGRACGCVHHTRTTFGHTISYITEPMMVGCFEL